MRVPGLYLLEALERQIPTGKRLELDVDPGARIGNGRRGDATALRISFGLLERVAQRRPVRRPPAGWSGRSGRRSPSRRAAVRLDGGWFTNK
jgi:hypothetical protein